MEFFFNENRFRYVHLSFKDFQFWCSNYQKEGFQKFKKSCKLEKSILLIRSYLLVVNLKI